MKVLKTIYNIIRLRAWKAALFSVNIHVCFLAIFYLLLVTTLSLKLWNILTLLIVIALYQAYMYLINDFYDTESDKIVGKKRALHELSKLQIISLLSVIPLAGLIIVLFFAYDILFIIEYLFMYFLATFYSAPPTRYKGRGWSGIVCDSVIEKALPVLLVFTYFNHFQIDTLLFFILMVIIQLFTIIQHQIEDYDGDFKTDINTLVVEIGKDKAKKMLDEYIFPIFFIFSLFFCLFIAIKIPFGGAIIVIFLLIVSVVPQILVHKGIISDEGKPFPIYVLSLYIFLYGILTAILALMVIFEDPKYFLLFLFFAISQYFDKFTKDYYIYALKDVLKCFQQFETKIIHNLRSK